MLLKDGDDTSLGRHFHEEQMASEPRNDGERGVDLVRLLLSVGDRTANDNGCNCLYSIISPCYKFERPFEGRALTRRSKNVRLEVGVLVMSGRAIVYQQVT